jgi:tripartite-type tricarboxylate transporter receptor subunit TctC
MTPRDLRLFAGVVASCAGFAVWGQSYPSQPLRMLVGYPPGGGSDVVARLAAQRLGESLGQQIVVDNRPGAATMMASQLAAKANADGYTILFVTSSLVINPSLYAKVPYDPFKDFSPVSLVASTPFVLVVHPGVPVSSVKELIALARAKGGQLNYSSGGSGSTGHLATELFKSIAGIEMQHIPYKGLGPALNDLLGGRVTLTFGSLPSVLQHMRSGRLKSLGLTSARRMQSLPDLPTIAESGLPGYEVDQWFGIVVPTGTLKPVIRKLNETIAKVTDLPDYKERISAIGAEPLHTTPERFGAYIKQEYAKWAKVIAVSGARVD